MLKITTNDILEITKDSFIVPSIERGTVEIIDKSLYLSVTLNIDNIDKEYSKYMEYFVILSTNDDFLDEFNDNTFNLNDVKSKVLVIKRFYADQKFITLKTEKVELLKCFIVPILNMQEFLSLNEIDYRDFPYDYVTNNNIISDIIIENDKLISQSYVFYKNDNLYLGPVLKEGTFFFSSDGEQLTYVLVPNNKFVDYRVFRDSEEPPLFAKQNGFSLTPSQETQVLTLKKSYLNSLGLSQKDKNTFYHFFTFDFFDCFKDNILLKNVNFNSIPFSIALYKKDNIEPDSYSTKLPDGIYPVEYYNEYSRSNNFSLDYSNNTQDVSGEQRFVFDERMSSYKAGNHFIFCLKSNFNDKKFNNSYFVKISFKEPSRDLLKEMLDILKEQKDVLNNILQSFTQNDSVQDDKVMLCINNIVDTLNKIKDYKQEDKEYVKNNLYTALSTFYGTKETFSAALSFIDKEYLYYQKLLQNLSQRTEEIEFKLRLDDIVSSDNIALASIIDDNFILFEKLLQTNQNILNKSGLTNFDYQLVQGKNKYTISEQLSLPEQINSYTLTKINNGKDYFLDKESYNEVRFVQLLFEIMFNDSLGYFCDVTTLQNLKNFIEEKIDLNKELIFDDRTSDLYKIISGTQFLQSIKTDKQVEDYKRQIYDYISLCTNVVLGSIIKKYNKFDIVDFLSVDSKNSIFKKYDIDSSYLTNLPYHYKVLIFTNLFTNVFLMLHYYLLYKNVYYVEFFDTSTREWKKIDYSNLKEQAYVCRFVKYKDEYIDEYVSDVRDLKINLANKVFIMDKRTAIANAISAISLQEIKPKYNNSKTTTNNFIDKQKVDKLNNAKKF